MSIAPPAQIANGKANHQYDDYVSFQIEIDKDDAGANVSGGTYPVGLYGDWEIEVSAIQLQFTTDPTWIEVELYSPNLQLQYGNNRYYRLMYPFPAHTLNNGISTFKTKTNIAGSMLIQPRDPATGTLPVNFERMTLTCRARRC